MKTSYTVKAVLAVLGISLSACNGGQDVSLQASPANQAIDPVSQPTPAPSVTPSPAPSPSPSPSASPTPYVFSGSGTQPDPYRLQTASDVDHIRDYPAAHFQVMQDISLASLGSFTPIPSFSGVIYGQSFQLTNISIASPSNQTAAFFSSLSGTVVSLTFRVTNSSVSGYATAVAGSLSGMLSSCRVYGTITSPAGGNGYNVGTGNPVYVIKTGTASLPGIVLDVQFNGNRVNNPDRL
jgi:predicted small secreted protein